MRRLPLRPARPGDVAGPFTLLCWDFRVRHGERLAGDPWLALPPASMHRLAGLVAVRARAQGSVRGIREQVGLTGVTDDVGALLRRQAVDAQPSLSRR